MLNIKYMTLVYKICCLRSCSQKIAVSNCARPAPRNYCDFLWARPYFHFNMFIFGVTLEYFTFFIFIIRSHYTFNQSNQAFHPHRIQKKCTKKIFSKPSTFCIYPLNQSKRLRSKVVFWLSLDYIFG